MKMYGDCAINKFPDKGQFFHVTLGYTNDSYLNAVQYLCIILLITLCVSMCLSVLSLLRAHAYTTTHMHTHTHTAS